MLRASPGGTARAHGPIPIARTARAGRGRPCARVLVEDPELAAAVMPIERGRLAREASVASVLSLVPGAWTPVDDWGRAAGGYGLLILEGALVRQTIVDGRIGAELLGDGELLSPSQEGGNASSTLPMRVTWRAISAGRLAILDGGWAARMARFPEVSAELTRRALARSGRLGRVMAITECRQLDARLLMLFSELADRFGRVHPDGIHIDLRLTHELLGQLVRARRPSVSTALSRLIRRGCVRPNGRGYVIAAAALARAGS